MKLLKNTKVQILAGKDKGKTGVVERVLREDSKVVVAGINIVKKHLKPSKQHPSGGIIEVSMPIHQSNVKVIDSEEK